MWWCGPNIYLNAPTFRCDLVCNRYFRYRCVYDNVPHKCNGQWVVQRTQNSKNRRKISKYLHYTGGMAYIHYGVVIMSVIASQITSLMIVYSTVKFRRRSKKTSKLSVTGLYAGNSPVTGELPTQRASNAENVSIWWRHHVFTNGVNGV